MRYGLVGFLITGLSLVLMSCTGVMMTRLSPSPESRQVLSDEIRSDFNSIIDFRGTATLTFDSPEQSGRVNSEIHTRPYFKATIDLKMPFGGQAGRVEIRENFVAFYTPDGTLKYIGSPEDAGIPGLPSIFTGSTDILRVLIGAINLPERSEAKFIRESRDHSRFVWEYVSDSLRQEYWIDPVVRRVVKYKETPIANGNTITIDLSKYLVIDGIQLPRSITVMQPGEKRMFSIYYNDIEIIRNEYAYVR